MSVFTKLLAVQGKLKAPKSQRNKYGKYNYRNCEDILEAVKPLLAENGAVIVLADNLELIGERYYVKATAKFVDVETGEWEENTAYAREEEVQKGLVGSQITGASSSYARKYALNGLLAIDDTKDADTTNNAPEPMITKEQIARMQELQVKTENVLRKYGVDRIEDITQAQAEYVIRVKERVSGQ